MDSMERLKKAVYDIRGGKEKSSVRGALVDIARNLPKSPESISLYRLGISLLDRVADPVERHMATLDFVKEIPVTEAFHPLHLETAEAAVTAADALDAQQHRITELIRLAESMPKT